MNTVYIEFTKHRNLIIFCYVSFIDLRYCCQLIIYMFNLSLYNNVGFKSKIK